ncbi:MGMT family protein [Candidatus Bathyarchaeota archaeon]|nr:MGMT family protein [Candidatus Bathyarchaeota archaeon]
MRKSKTWREKLEKAQEPKVVETPKGKMLVPKPLDVDAMLRRIEKGKIITLNQLRAKLAKDFCADYTCPLTTGIFVWIAAETAEEDLKAGRKEVTPYWRIIRNDGSLNEKFPGGAEAQAARLKKEGHAILPAQDKKPPKVKDYEKVMQKL